MASGKSWKLLGNSQLCIHLCVMNGPLVTARLRIRELRVDDAYNILLLNSDPEVLTYVHDEIGRASCRKECRSRWSPYH